MNNPGIYNWELSQKLGALQNPARAEKLLLVLLAMNHLARNEGLLRLNDWLDKSWLPPLLHSPLDMIRNKVDPEKIFAGMEREIIEGGARGQDLLERLLVLEGIRLTINGAHQNDLFEQLAGFFGEDYYYTLKKNIRLMRQK